MLSATLQVHPVCGGSDKQWTVSFVEPILVSVEPHFHDRNNRCFFHVLLSRIFGDCTYVHIFMQCINVCHNVNKTVVSIGQDTK